MRPMLREKQSAHEALGGYDEATDAAGDRHTATVPV